MRCQADRAEQNQPGHFTRLASLLSNVVFRFFYFIKTIRIALLLTKMSDYEDEMDVDDAPVKGSVMFSSDNTNTKGKRSAANLPIEAEDSLPW